MSRTKIIGYRRDGRPIHPIAGAAGPNLDELDLAGLRARRDEITARMTEIHRGAGDDELSDEQTTEWEALDAEHKDVAARIEKAETEERTAQRRQRAADSRARFGAQLGGTGSEPFDGTDLRSLRHGELRDRAMRVLEDRSANPALTDRQAEHVERLLRTRNRNLDGADLARRLLTTENPHYRSAFQKLTTLSQPVLTPEESRAVEAWYEYRAMALDPDTAGGYGMPVLIDPTIILTAQGSPNYFFNLSRVETITTSAWRGVSSDGVTWGFGPEASPATDDSPSLDQPIVNVHRADGFIPYSIEIGQDYPGFADEMARLLSEGYSELLVHKLTLGAGDSNNEPFGIITALTGTASVVDVGTTGSIDADDVNALWAALPIRYRRPGDTSQRTAWMSHTSVNNAIQRLGAGNDLSGFTVDFTAEGVLVLKGRRAHVNDYFRQLNGAAQGLLVVGDWENYLIAQRAGMSVELVPHLTRQAVAGAGVGMPTGQRGWYAWARVGADSINDDGFRMLSDDGA